MGQIIASELMGTARRLLQDQSNVAERWSDEVLLAGLNEGQRTLVNLKHDAYTRADVVDVSGGTGHYIPEDSVAFIRLTRNMGSDGKTPGKAIHMISVSQMDLADPDWHVAEKGRQVLHGMFDERDERRFYIWPRVDGYVELIHTVLPEDIPTKDDPITLDDVYAPALIAYIVYYAIAQDMDSAPNRELAQIWFGQFTQLLAGKISSEESLIRGKY